MPRTETRPRVGLSCPLAMRRSVDLPAPFAPTKPVIPPVSSSVTWLSASTEPYHLETCSKSNRGAGSGDGVSDEWSVVSGELAEAGAGQLGASMGFSNTGLRLIFTSTTHFTHHSPFK